jgi:endoglucanase
MQFVRRVAVLAALLSSVLMASPVSAGAIDPGTRFWAGEPNPAALTQIARLKAAGRTNDARRIRRMVNVPQALWFTYGTPSEVAGYVSAAVDEAQDAGRVPVFVAYNVPGRDCSLYSAGGAANGAAYRAWIDGMVDGLGNAPALIIVEPDGLALLPSDCGQADPYDRVGLIRYAAHAFLADPNAHIYIDAGNSNWNTVNLMAERLVDVGVDDVDGFALNVSNFQFTVNSNVYGSWISKCIEFATHVDPGNYDACPDQYGSFGGVALSSYGRWSDSADNAALNTRAENNRYRTLLNGATPRTHFVVDTSRNARGPWKGTNAHPAANSNTEAWCNPPGRGAGKRPTADTNLPLVDAYLWIKTAGESDGECFRWTEGPKDPYRGIRDPQAGAWFPALALELARNADPSF